MPIRILKKDRARDNQAKQQSAMAQTQGTPNSELLKKKGIAAKLYESKGSEKAREPMSPSARRDERKAQQREQRITLKEYGMKKGGLKGNQKKLDKNNNNRIDAQDFKILRGGRAAMKARKGKLVPLKSDPTKAISSVKPSAGGKGGPSSKTPKQARSAVMDFIARRKKLAGAGRIGAAATLIGLAGAGAAKLGQTIGRKYFGDPTKKEKNKMSKPIKGKNKKMAGGMMKKYNKGGMSASEKFKSEVKAIKETIDDKNTPMKGDRMLTGLKAAHKKAFPKKKMGGGMMKRYNKGGGADTGRVGELKSKIAVATDKLKKHFQKRKRRPDYIKPPERKPMIPANVAETARSVSSFTPTGMGQQIAKKLTGKMGGGMMSKPMGYKSGASVKVKCKLGRNKPTKMY